MTRRAPKVVHERRRLANGDMKVTVRQGNRKFVGSGPREEVTDELLAVFCEYYGIELPEPVWIGSAPGPQTGAS